MLLSPRINATRKARQRAKRFAVRTSLRYRISGESQWRQGTTENISASGVLFRCEHSLEPRTPIEMSWAVPVAVLGSAGAQVDCRGIVVRALKDAGLGSQGTLASSISHYRIIRP